MPPSKKREFRLRACICTEDSEQIAICRPAREASGKPADVDLFPIQKWEKGASCCLSPVCGVGYGSLSQLVHTGFRSPSLGSLLTPGCDLPKVGGSEAHALWTDSYCLWPSRSLMLWKAPRRWTHCRRACSPGSARPPRHRIETRGGRSAERCCPESKKLTCVSDWTGG